VVAVGAWKESQRRMVQFESLWARKIARDVSGTLG
jgi:hypothetical protein